MPNSSRKLDNPEDCFKRAPDIAKLKFVTDSVPVQSKPIASTELKSCMEYPARFVPFINGHNRLPDQQVHMLRPLEKGTTCNKLSQSTQFVRPLKPDLDRATMQLCVEMALDAIDDSSPCKSMHTTGRVIQQFKHELEELEREQDSLVRKFLARQV